MGDLKTRFGIMMFLQYAIWGSWTTALGAHLDKLGFSGSEISAIWFIDFAVLPKFQGQGLGKILTKAWMKLFSMLALMFG